MLSRYLPAPALEAALSAQREAQSRSRDACVLLADRLGLRKVDPAHLLPLVDLALVKYPLHEGIELWATTRGVELPLFDTPIVSAAQARHTAHQYTQDAIFAVWLQLKAIRSTIARTDAECIVQFLSTAAAHGILNEVAEKWAATNNLNWRALVSAATSQEGSQ